MYLWYSDNMIVDDVFAENYTRFHMMWVINADHIDLLGYTIHIHPYPYAYLIKYWLVGRCWYCRYPILLSYLIMAYHHLSSFMPLMVSLLAQRDQPHPNKCTVNQIISTCQRFRVELLKVFPWFSQSTLPGLFRSSDMRRLRCSKLQGNSPGFHGCQNHLTQTTRRQVESHRRRHICSSLFIIVHQIQIIQWILKI